MAIGGEIPPEMLPENQPTPIDPLTMAPRRAVLLSDGFTEEELDADTDELDGEGEGSDNTLVVLLVGGAALGVVVLLLTMGSK